VGAVTGQDVLHAHLHLIARFSGELFKGLGIHALFRHPHEPLNRYYRKRLPMGGPFLFGKGHESFSECLLRHLNDYLQSLQPAQSLTGNYCFAVLPLNV
jgi:hypothetical protein